MTITEANAVNRLIDGLVGTKQLIDLDDVCTLAGSASKALNAGWTPAIVRRHVARRTGSTFACKVVGNAPAKRPRHRAQGAA